MGTASSSPEFVAEKRDSERPGLLDGAAIGPGATTLVAGEAVSGAFERMNLVRLVVRLQVLLRRRNGGANPRIVTGEQAQHRSVDLREDGTVGVRAVEHDGGPVALERGGHLEALAAAPAEAHGADAILRRGQRGAVARRGVQAAGDF